MQNSVSGFSKFTKSQKIDWIVKTYLSGNKEAESIIKQYWNSNEKLQQLHDEFIENTVTNFYLPFGIAPNFLINGNLYTIPMAIEESSVVAAASKAAKFWMERGGFKATVLSTEKIGQVHFMYEGNPVLLQEYFNFIKEDLIDSVSDIVKNMKKRGGGITNIELRDRTEALEHYYQLHVTFETLDAMGANFINSCLEQFAKTFEEGTKRFEPFSINEGRVDIVMSILSNYVPNCLVRAEVSCPVNELSDSKDINGLEFAQKFIQAVNIAEVEPHRAVTHNKGIMNGIDAVVLATGNDFRAIEAGVHAYASRDGHYRSLTKAELKNGIFTFWMEIPLALGTVGGLTRLHPLVRIALELLGSPNAKDLMKIVAVAGLAQNFAALRSLVTTGIQEGHMKMHLMNILNEFEASPQEKEQLITHFKTNVVTHGAVSEALLKLRS